MWHIVHDPETGEVDYKKSDRIYAEHEICCVRPIGAGGRGWAKLLPTRKDRAGQLLGRTPIPVAETRASGGYR